METAFKTYDFKRNGKVLEEHFYLCLRQLEYKISKEDQVWIHNCFTENLMDETRMIFYRKIIPNLARDPPGFVRVKHLSR